MTLTELANNPEAQAAAVAAAMSTFSTIHTYLDKYPRAQTILKALAHFCGPLNLPSMRNALVGVCRAVVAYDDDRIFDALHAIDSAAKAVIHAETQPAAEKTTGTVKEWPK